MFKTKIYIILTIVVITISSCKAPDLGRQDVNKSVPASYSNSQDSTNTGMLGWKQFYSDANLVALIDSALANNQELNIALQEIAVSQNEVMAKKGEILPNVNANVGGGVDKVGRYTARGASEATTEIEPGKEMPDPMTDFTIGFKASWEVDIWRQLRNGRDAAAKRFLATYEGKNYMVTNLVAEIAESYYDLLAYDNQLAILNQNIEIQNNALEIVKAQKEAARVTELAVKRFEAEVYKTKSLQFSIQQEIVEAENKINFLVGRFPQRVQRSAVEIIDLVPANIQEGVPIQLLDNRPDIRRAENMLEASKLDIKIAKADFYPKLEIGAQLGVNAFNPVYIIRPQSIIYNVIGDLMAPLINRKVIKSKYYSANSMQIQAMYEYEQTLLKAYIEVANQISKIDNLSKSYELKAKQVVALSESIRISGDLFLSARADYMEVLLTQRDVLEAKFELVDTKKEQLTATINAYRALGGGWK
ncbi:MAG: TolC family protein [Crocinitomicaceae bacterium]